MVELPKDMRDSPEQAQAKSFFRCKFGHVTKDVEEEEEDAKSKKSKKKDEKNKSFFDGPQAGCVVCAAPVPNPLTDSVMDLTGDKVTMSFFDFIRSLMGSADDGITKKDSEKAKGCQVFFPSTIFFVGDRIDFIAGNDKGYMTMKTPGQFIN